MPLDVPANGPTILIRRSAFERAALTRAQLDDRLNLTPDEFRVEGDLIAVGPLFGDDAFQEAVELLEGAGLAQFDDFFELSGNWPDWLRLLVMARRQPAT